MVPSIIKCILSGGATPTLYGYVDFDYANTEECKSTSGYCFFYSFDLINWCSKKQPTVATSTTVAEYMVLYKATTEAIWLQKLSNDLSVSQGPTLI